MTEKCWTDQLADVADRLFKKDGHFTWNSLARGFYKHKPTSTELAGIVAARRALVERLRGRKIRCQLVGEYYFEKRKWGTKAVAFGQPGSPFDKDEAVQCLPHQGSAGMRLASIDDEIYTAFIMEENSKTRGKVEANQERSLEAITAKRLTSSSVFKIDQERNLAIFLRKVPIRQDQKLITVSNDVAEELPLTAKHRD